MFSAQYLTTEIIRNHDIAARPVLTGQLRAGDRILLTAVNPCVVDSATEQTVLARKVHDAQRHAILVERAVQILASSHRTSFIQALFARLLESDDDVGIFPYGFALRWNTHRTNLYIDVADPFSPSDPDAPMDTAVAFGMLGYYLTHTVTDAPARAALEGIIALYWPKLTDRM